MKYMAECPPLFYFVFNTNICTLPKLRLMSLNSTPFVDVCFYNVVYFVFFKGFCRFGVSVGYLRGLSGPQVSKKEPKGAKL